MREIKVRAWDHLTETMVYDFEETFDHHNSRHYHPVLGDGKLTVGVYDEKGDWHELKLMLSSGFPDKNGKEIYDGDLIQHLDEKMKVFFNESMGSWDLEYEGGDSINLVDEDGWDAEDFEVIGNIYETK